MQVQIVSGRVAEEEQVATAVISSLPVFIKYDFGVMPHTIHKGMIMTKNNTTNDPVYAQRTYDPDALSDSTPKLPVILAINEKTPRGVNIITRDRSFIRNCSNLSDIDSKAFTCKAFSMNPSKKAITIEGKYRELMVVMFLTENRFRIILPRDTEAVFPDHAVPSVMKKYLPG